MNAATERLPQRGVVYHDSTHDVMLPHIEEFVAEAGRFVADDTIILHSVRGEGFGVVDVVMVGRDATIGFVFGRALPDRPIPGFLDAVYTATALDVAHGLADVLYVAARNHASLFQADARLRLVPYCSSRILGHRPRIRSSYVGKGDDNQPFVIGLRLPGVGESQKHRRKVAARDTQKAGVAA
jgi:hypothetical protein